MRFPHAVSPCLLTIASTGFAATVAQILVLRELLALFYGNEISTGLVFACWLLWTALGSGLSGKLTARSAPRTTTLVCLLSLLAAILPAALIMIRAARAIWSIPAGELPSLWKMVMVSVSVTGSFCPISGALFGICWVLYRQRGDLVQGGQPLRIYMGEALGAALGGLIFYFLFLPHIGTFTAAVVTSTVVLALSWWILLSERLWPAARVSRVVLAGVSLLVLFCTIFAPYLEQMGRRLQWGGDLAAVQDTPYHNITVLRRDRQVSVFTNGLWLFSSPDILSAELAVHPALLQHPRPRAILLLGGGIAGHIAEILKHPEIAGIDYVEPDPELIPFIEEFLSPSDREDLRRKRVKLHSEDVTRFVRSQVNRYDVVLMNTGDPINAEMNRFYTEEFFQQVSRCLRPGGILSFAVSGGKEMMGPGQAQFMSSIHRTLISVFPQVLILPGDRSRFVATDLRGRLSSDVSELTDRIHTRRLDLSYIRRDTLLDILSPFRMDYVRSILDEFRDDRINRDFSPICYFQSLRLWASQLHPSLERWLAFLLSVRLATLWAVLAVAGMAICVFFWIGPLRYNSAVALSVTLSGALEMVLQIVLLLTFQVLEGFLYKQLALLIAFFMAGMGLGAAYIARWRGAREIRRAAAAQLFKVQAAFCLFPLFLVLLLPLLHLELRVFLSSSSTGWIFSGLSLITGALGGIHFSLAVSAYTPSDSAARRTGGMFYALDLAGSAGGALIASFFILPVYGLINALLLASVLSLVSLVTLLRH